MRGNRFCVVFALALVPAILLGQYGTGTILGTVKDPTGAVIPAAVITAKNNATNETRTFKTDTEGFYRFSALLSGTYTITAMAPSFRTAAVSNVVLTVNTQVRADITMQLGSVNETVEVADITPQLQTNTAVMGSVIDNRTMLELPLNARNFFDLVALTPGALKTSGTSSVMDERSIEIGGVRNTSTGAMLDGVDFTVINQNNPGIALSLDALAEFKVQANFMDASYGHGAAGIDMVTKRGSNAFHGVAYDFVRNRAFQAGQFFRPARGAPRFTYNQFGFNAGGPHPEGQDVLLRQLRGPSQKNRRDSPGPGAYGPDAGRRLFGNGKDHQRPAQRQYAFPRKRDPAEPLRHHHTEDDPILSSP